MGGPLCFNFFPSSPSLNITSPFHNPLAEDEDISWTKEMISKLKKGYSEDRTFTPTCYMVCELYYLKSFLI